MELHPADVLRLAEVSILGLNGSYFSAREARIMERDVAIRIDGMLAAVLASMNGIAHCMKDNISEEEYKSLVGMVGTTMGEIIEFSSALHKMFPDIIPKELKPSLDAQP